MKKAVFAAMLALAGLVIVGCAGSKAENPVAAWQADRICADAIAAKNAAGKPVTVEDVAYKSTMETPALASAINVIALVPAPMYLKVVTEVDKLNAAAEGRLIYIGIQNDLAAGATWEKDILPNMTAEDITAYNAYKASIAQVNQDSIIKDVVMPMIAQLTAESAKLAAQVDALRKSKEFQALAGFQLAKEGAKLASDAKAIGSMFADATTGANLWLELLKRDAEAKKFMQDYPVK